MRVSDLFVKEFAEYADPRVRELARDLRDEREAHAGTKRQLQIADEKIRSLDHLQSCQSVELAERDEQIAIQTKAANHWFKDANEKHNLVFHLEEKLAAAEARVARLEEMDAANDLVSLRLINERDAARAALRGIRVNLTHEDCHTNLFTRACVRHIDELLGEAALSGVPAAQEANPHCQRCGVDCSPHPRPPIYDVTTQQDICPACYDKQAGIVRKPQRQLSYVPVEPAATVEGEGAGDITSSVITKLGDELEAGDAKRPDGTVQDGRS